MTTNTTPNLRRAESPAEGKVLDVQQTSCCVVGGGPAGAVLALMLARKGIAVTLLEAHGDFDRDFRGDTLHPSVMENMAELGLADRYPNFRLAMGASARELIEEDGAIRGLRYRSRDGLHEVRAALTVGADGRFSRVRRLAGFEPVKTSAPMDALWFHLPRSPDEPDVDIARISGGRIGILLNRGDL